MSGILLRDESWLCMLSTQVKPTENIKDKAVLLEVDTSIWFVFYNGVWYQQ